MEWWCSGEAVLSLERVRAVWSMTDSSSFRTSWDGIGLGREAATAAFMDVLGEV